MSRGATGSYGLLGQAMRSNEVRKALRARAEKVRSAAESIASSEGVELNTTVTEGTRPKGRPYARVASPNVAQEWGDSNTARRRVLGRAAEGQR